MKGLKIPRQVIELNNFIRCINKDTFDYVDIPIPRGTCADVRLAILDTAYSYSWNVLTSEGEKPEYDYYALFSLNNPNKDMEDIGVFGLIIKGVVWSDLLHQENHVNKTKEGDSIVTIEVDLTTNKVIMNDMLKEILEKTGNYNIYDYISRDKLI
jgi:hypothetical protein